MNNLCIRSDNSTDDYRQDLREIYGSIKTFRSIDLTLNNRVHIIDIGLESALNEICERVASIKENVKQDLEKVRKASCLGINVKTQRFFNRVFSSIDTGSVISGIALEIFNAGSTHKMVIGMVFIGQCFSKVNDFVSGSLRDLRVKEVELKSIESICLELERYSSELHSIHSIHSNSIYTDEVDGNQYEIPISKEIIKNRWKDTVGKLLNTIKKTPTILREDSVNIDIENSENSDNYDTCL